MTSPRLALAACLLALGVAVPSVSVAQPARTAAEDQPSECPTRSGRARACQAPSPRPSDAGTTPPGRSSDETSTPPGQVEPSTPAADETGQDRPSSPRQPNVEPLPPPTAEPGPLPPDLTGTRVLASRIGPLVRVADEDGVLHVGDLVVEVTETDAAGIDGGWWVSVTATGGRIEPSGDPWSDGHGGVPRSVSDAIGPLRPLFTVSGQRSGERYQARYGTESTVTVRDATQRPVVTVLMVQ